MLGLALLAIQVFARPSTAIPVGPEIPAVVAMKGQLPPAGDQGVPLRVSWKIALVSIAEAKTSPAASRVSPYELPIGAAYGGVREPFKIPAPVAAVGETWEMKLDPEETQMLPGVARGVDDWLSAIRRTGLEPTVLEICTGVTGVAEVAAPGN